MNRYILTFYDLSQDDVFADDIGEAFQLAKQLSDLEVISIEKVLGI